MLVAIGAVIFTAFHYFMNLHVIVYATIASMFSALAIITIVGALIVRFSEKTDDRLIFNPLKSVLALAFTSTEDRIEKGPKYEKLEKLIASFIMHAAIYLAALLVCSLFFADTSHRYLNENAVLLLTALRYILATTFLVSAGYFSLKKNAAPEKST
jgi:hypothetical protein